MSIQNLAQHSRHWIDFFRDAEYFRRLYKTALPIATQQFIMSSLNMVGVIMIGQLGDAPVAAVGLANQIFFLLNLILFGINSGMAIFTAQLWGKHDIPNIHRVLGLALSMGAVVGLFFFGVAQFAPQAALGIYTKDPAVVELGSQYLHIFGWSFLFIPVSFSYALVLRSTGEVRIPLVVTLITLSLNTLLSFGLIFGNFGLPRLETRGAAIAVLVARIFEMTLLLWITYRRRTPAAARLSDMFNQNISFISRVLKPVLPVAFNELFWSLGITTYNVVYARIGTDAIAAMNIASSIETLALVIFSGVGHACAILVGHQIGAGDEKNAYRYAVRSLSLGALGGVLVGGLIMAGSGPLLTLYKVSPQVIDYAHKVLTILSLLLWLRATNMILFIGVLRSGGDTRFAFLLDAVIIWVLGVPMAFLGAFVFHLPVYWVYLMVLSEELTKCVLGLWRVYSKKWIHNLAQTV
ncbi:MAG: MATE family efflux transporter [Anaerolineales bacterium]|nr:MATE family efflux transporter [Anaerolineales bacterium]